MYLLKWRRDTGLRKADGGEIILRDERINDLGAHVRRKKGIAHVPEDRIRRGLAPDLSVLDNLIMEHHRRAPLSRGLRLNYTKAAEKARDLIRRYSILTPALGIAARSLSGGNLQKLVIAREFDFNPQLLVISHPSRGIDIRTIRFVHNEIIKRRNSGDGVLLVSGDLDEVLALSDRIGVMYRGRLVKPTEPTKTNKKELGMYMTGALS